MIDLYSLRYVGGTAATEYCGNLVTDYLITCSTRTVDRTHIEHLLAQDLDMLSV
jgi:hypothetical protein